MPRGTKRIGEGEGEGEILYSTQKKIALGLDKICYLITFSKKMLLHDTTHDSNCVAIRKSLPHVIIILYSLYMYM